MFVCVAEPRLPLQIESIIVVTVGVSSVAHVPVKLYHYLTMALHKLLGSMMAVIRS
jgi:hypothetical protein